MTSIALMQKGKLMNDLISRQAAQAIKVLPECYRNYQTDNLDDAYEKGWEDAMFSLNALSTIDPVKHGKWMAIGNTGLAACECGYVTDRYSIYNYCPNCGAKVDGGEG